MNLLESVNMAFATLAANKLRSGLTMLGIIIGNASVISMIGIGQGAQNLVLGKLEAFGANQSLSHCHTQVEMQNSLRRFLPTLQLLH